MIDDDISIHAPSRERQYAPGRIRVKAKFQSTLPRGSDKLSITFRFTQSDFNPRSLAGATTQFKLNQASSKFQSTLPRGSDRRCLHLWYRRCNFNPRSLAGATTFPLHRPHVRSISIHAPSRERHHAVYAAG